MSHIHYYFDTDTSQYKRVKRRFIDVAVNTIGILILSLFFAIAISTVYLAYTRSPKEVKLSNELTEMHLHFNELNGTVVLLKDVLEQIAERDANIYRNVLGSEPLHFTLREIVRDDSETYSELEFIATLNQQINELKSKLYLESISQDEVVKFAMNKEMRFASIPAIQPIANKALVAIASGFGMRIHPIYKVVRLHTGIDFAAPTGTPIYATAYGHVVAVDENFVGYGKMVIIDHGFGYTTRYAHLQDFLVKVGQSVKRGAPIGYVGNTGLSTAPHLHYEILVNGEQIDPVHYFFDDLSPIEYEKVIALASIKNQSLGN